MPASLIKLDSFTNLESLATERTEPSVGRELLGIDPDEFVDLVASLLDAELARQLRLDPLPVLCVGPEARLGLSAVLLALLAAGAQRGSGGVRRQAGPHEYDAAAVGHGVLLLILGRVVEVDRVHDAQVEHEPVEHTVQLRVDVERYSRRG